MRIEVVDLAGRECFVLPTPLGWTLVSWPFDCVCRTGDDRTTIDAHRYRDVPIESWIQRLAGYDNCVEIGTKLERQMLADVQSEGWRERAGIEGWFIGNLDHRIDFDEFLDRCRRFFEAWDRQQKEPREVKVIKRFELGTGEATKELFDRLKPK